MVENYEMVTVEEGFDIKVKAKVSNNALTEMELLVDGNVNFALGYIAGERAILMNTADVRYKEASATAIVKAAMLELFSFECGATSLLYCAGFEKKEI